MNYKNIDEKAKRYRQIKAELSADEIKNYDLSFAIEFTHNSTAIEGNTRSLIETKMILEDKIIPAETSEREYNEIYNNDKAFDFVKEHAAAEKGIDEDFIKDVHSKVMDRMPHGTPGIYRTTNITVAGATHEFVDFTDVRQEMKNFTADLQEAKKDLHPVEKAAWAHAEFVRVHPFPDGNGRTSRLIMNKVLLENKYPPIAIKKDQARDYFQALDTYMELLEI